MKHSINELYKIKGKNGLFTAEAVKFINHAPLHKAKLGDASQAIYKVAQAKPFRIYKDIDRKEFQLGYLYGEKIWFDTKEELENYREELRRQ